MLKIKCFLLSKKLILSLTVTMLLSVAPAAICAPVANNTLNNTANPKTLAALQQQLTQHAIIRGQFEQVRHLKMFAKPLRSAGQFVIDKKSGLLWDQQTPFPVHLVLTQNTLRQTFAKQKTQIVKAEQNPMVFYFSRIFLSVFHGDMQKLQQEFSLTFTRLPATQKQANWSVTLKPKHAPLNKVFKQIQLQGAAEINRLTLQELRGDYTEIIFSHQSHLPAHLTHKELQQFSN